MVAVQHFGGVPRVCLLWSLFSTPCDPEAFLEVLNDRVAHPNLSGDFSSGNPYSEPPQSPPVVQYRLFSLRLGGKLT